MDKIKFTLLFLIGIALVLIGVLFFLTFDIFQGITGGVVLNQYSYTKAICNETNFCEDYVVNCRGSEVVSVIATGAAIQNLPEWKDPRDQETISRFC